MDICPLGGRFSRAFYGGKGEGGGGGGGGGGARGARGEGGGGGKTSATINLKFSTGQATWELDMRVFFPLSFPLFHPPSLLPDQTCQSPTSSTSAAPRSSEDH